MEWGSQGMPRMADKGGRELSPGVFREIVALLIRLITDL